MDVDQKMVRNRFGWWWYYIILI